MKKKIKWYIINVLIYVAICMSFSSGPLVVKEIDELLRHLNGEKAAQIKELQQEEDEIGELIEKELKKL